MNYQAGLDHIDQEKFSPCYLITGEETVLVDALLRRFLEKGIDPSLVDFNINRFSGEAVRPETVVSTANTFPVSSPRRIVIIRNAEQLKDEQGAILEYLAQPSETSVLIFVSIKPDMRKKLFSTLKRLATTMACPRLYRQELSEWISTEADKVGLRLSQEAQWFMKEQIGNDLSSLQREIEKISLYLAGENKQSENEVSGEVVQKIIGGGRNHSIFELIRAIGDKDGSNAIRLLNQLMAEGAHPLFILSMLTRSLRQMAMAKEALSAGLTENAIAKKVPMPRGLLKPFLQQLAKWQKEEIQMAFAQSLSADSQLKGGRLSQIIVMESLLLDLCYPAHSPSGRRAYSLPFRLQEGF